MSTAMAETSRNIIAMTFNSATALHVIAARHFQYWAVFLICLFFLFSLNSPRFGFRHRHHYSARRIDRRLYTYHSRVPQADSVRTKYAE